MIHVDGNRIILLNRMSYFALVITMYILNVINMSILIVINDLTG